MPPPLPLRSQTVAPEVACASYPPLPTARHATLTPPQQAAATSLIKSADAAELLRRAAPSPPAAPLVKHRRGRRGSG